MWTLLADIWNTLCDTNSPLVINNIQIVACGSAEVCVLEIGATNAFNFGGCHD